MQGSGVFRRLTLMFTSGLLVILPLAGTVYLLRYVYQLINGWGLALLPEDIRFPGLGLLVVVGLVLFIGFLARIWLTRKVFDFVDRLIQRLPFIKGVYGTLKDTIHSLFGEKKSFDTVVFVPVAGTRRIGFLTVKEPCFKTADGKEYVGVYLPQSMQFAGDLHWFEREEIEVLDLSVDEAMRIILSAGVSKGTPENE